jgi:hypothetical protein
MDESDNLIKNQNTNTFSVSAQLTDTYICKKKQKKIQKVANLMTRYIYNCKKQINVRKIIIIGIDYLNKLKLHYIMNFK